MPTGSNFLKARPKIALDGRRLYGNKRGVGQYVYQLCVHLPGLAPDFEFILFVDRRLPEDSVPAGWRQIQVGKPFTTASQSRSGFHAKAYSFYWMNFLVPQVLKKEGVAIFHGTNFALPLFTSGRYVVTVHDLIYARVPGAFERMYERYLSFLVPRSVRRARRVIAVSETTRQDIIDLLRIAPKRVITIYHGVDRCYTSVRDPGYLANVRQSLRLPERFVLYVGAIERRKCLEVLVRAGGELVNRGIIDRVVLAGEEGYGAEAVRKTVSELQMEEKVQYIGYVRQEFLPGLYQLARCLVLVSWYEGFGMPVLEAMASGTPVVTANVSALAEVAGDAALLVPPNDKEALVQALQRLLTDEDLRATLINKGINRAQEFTWEKTAARHIEVYRGLLGAGDV